MSYVFHRHCKATYPVAESGQGCHIVDSTGKYYLDASGGAAVSCLGHSNERVRNAIHQQLDKLAFAHSGFFTTAPLEELAEFLITRAPSGLERVYFVSGGSEAVEAAIKLARQFFLETDRPNKTRIISRWQSYHGNTLGALSVGGNKWRRKQYEPYLMDCVSHISPCYAYRGQKENETIETYGLRVANELEEEINKYGADNVAAFIAEPIVGATMGAVPAVAGYFERIKAICEQYDILLILDEVMCGMGRTGSLFACEQENITADILVSAKGLGAGYEPIGAMLVSEPVYEAIELGSGFFQHGHTYMGHALSCAGSLAVLKEIEEKSLLEEVKKKGTLFQHSLIEAFGNHPFVGDIRGRGLFIGIELVSDDMLKTPFESKLKLHNHIKSFALEEGLMCYPMGGTIDGVQGDHVLFAPPFIISEEEIEEAVSKFATALEKALQFATGISL